MSLSDTLLAKLNELHPPQPSAEEMARREAARRIYEDAKKERDRQLAEKRKAIEVEKRLEQKKQQSRLEEMTKKIQDAIGLSDYAKKDSTEWEKYKKTYMDKKDFFTDSPLDQWDYFS
jgi:phage-related minor tail protein